MKIIRSRRRTIGLEISPEAELIVRVPLHVDDKEIERVIVQKRGWIVKSRERIAQYALEHPAKEFREGEEFYYLGRRYPLFLKEKLIPALFFDNGFLLARDYRYKARELFFQWYRRQAGLYIPERVRFFCSRGAVRCAEVTIRNTGSRWGSCGRNGKLNFSCRLMMAPPEVIDYVVAHEVAHLVVMNHSRKFWNRVEELFPGYGKYRSWLRDNGRLLVI